MTKETKNALINKLCEETENLYWALYNQDDEKAAIHRQGREEVEEEIRKLCYVTKVWDINEMIAKTDTALKNIRKPC